MVSQEILMGTTAHRRDPPIGTLRQSPCSGTHPPHTQGHAPTNKGGDLPESVRVTALACRCCPRWRFDTPWWDGMGERTGLSSHAEVEDEVKVSCTIMEENRPDECACMTSQSGQGWQHEAT